MLSLMWRPQTGSLDVDALYRRLLLTSASWLFAKPRTKPRKAQDTHNCEISWSYVSHLFGFVPFQSPSSGNLISLKPQLSIPVRPERSAVGAKSKGPERCFDFARCASYAQHERPLGSLAEIRG